MARRLALGLADCVCAVSTQLYLEAPGECGLSGKTKGLPRLLEITQVNSVGQDALGRLVQLAPSVKNQWGEANPAAMSQ